MERLSTGFVNALNILGSVKSVMANGVIHLYSGTQPATADAAETGTLLMIYTQNSAAFVSGSPGNGLNMDASVDGVLSKKVSEVWSGNGLPAAGAIPGIPAGWYRWYANTVVTGDSTTAIRLDGAVGTSSSYELQMTNTSIVNGGPSIISNFTFTIPKA
jgi:hypothetical protein